MSPVERYHRRKPWPSTGVVAERPTVGTGPRRKPAPDPRNDLMPTVPILPATVLGVEYVIHCVKSFLIGITIPVWLPFWLIGRVRR